MTNPTVYPGLHFTDADAGMAFLRAIGFIEKAVYRNAADPSQVDHAEFAWGERGGVMCGSASRTDGGSYTRSVGTGDMYLVVPTDADVDAVHARAIAAGGRSIEAPKGVDYGGRSAGFRDPEGNQFSIGSYPGE